MRLFVVDTIATIFFFTVVATFSELVIAGVDPNKVFVTRLVMVPMMVLMGRPYGVWRDWLFQRVRPRSQLSKITLDIAAFLSFQAPVYAATLMLAGADLAEVVAAVSSATMFMVILSRPFGLFLEIARKTARVSAV